MGKLDSVQFIQDSVHIRRTSLTGDEIEELAQTNAAIRIQRAWRAKKIARYLETDFLWRDLATHARLKVSL